MVASELAVEHLFTVTAFTATPPTMVSDGPSGTRGILEATGGSFEGPRLRGRVVPPGGDWFTVRRTGSLRIDARLLLKTEDDHPIFMAYSGIARPIEGGMVIHTAPMFEVGEGPYAWLNDVQAIGLGRLVDGGVEYAVYGLTS